jgi:hypothetical protein
MYMYGARQTAATSKHIYAQTGTHHAMHQTHCLTLLLRGKHDCCNCGCSFKEQLLLLLLLMVLLRTCTPQHTQLCHDLQLLQRQPCKKQQQQENTTVMTLSSVWHNVLKVC